MSVQINGFTQTMNNPFTSFSGENYYTGLNETAPGSYYYYNGANLYIFQYFSNNITATGTVTIPYNATINCYLVGGGGGGNGAGGGGGGGNYKFGSLSVFSGSSMTLTIGAGGSGSSGSSGSSGGNTTFNSTFVANGGTGGSGSSQGNKFTDSLGNNYFYGAGGGNYNSGGNGYLSNGGLGDNGIGGAGGGAGGNGGNGNTGSGNYYPGGGGGFNSPGGNATNSSSGNGGGPNGGAGNNSGSGGNGGDGGGGGGGFQGDGGNGGLLGGGGASNSGNGGSGGAGGGGGNGGSGVYITGTGGSGGVGGGGGAGTAGGNGGINGGGGGAGIGGPLGNGGNGGVGLIVLEIIQQPQPTPLIPQFSTTYNYNPIPPRVWSRVQAQCTYTAPNSSYDSVYIPILNQTTSLAQAISLEKNLYKGNILQYKANSSRLTKNQRYSQISKGFGSNRTKVFATQSQTYSNPNTTGLLRVNYTTLPYPNQIVGKPNNISGPFQYNVPNPSGCPTTSVQDGGNLVCGTYVNPCSGNIIQTIPQPELICNSSTASDVPGIPVNLCWTPNFQTFFPRNNLTMNNSLSKWPEGYKGLVSAVTPVPPILSLDASTNTTATLSWSFNSNVCIPISSFNIYQDGVIVQTQPYPITSTEITGLSFGILYLFYVTSVSNNIESLPSNTITT